MVEANAAGGLAHDVDDPVEMAAAISRFAAASHFRSATVDELELRGDFCRRPLRPEDLPSIAFAVPVAADTICDLPSLAAHRILRCMYDLPYAGLARQGDRGTLAQRARFSDDASRLLAVRTSPFLERFAFGFLDDLGAAEHAPSPAATHAELEASVREADVFARRLLTPFAKGLCSRAELRFLLIQHVCLGATARVELARAQANGFFDLIADDDRPQLGSERAENAALARMANVLDVAREPHAFWQFYLPTSLAETNYLAAAASRPERALVLLGASFVADARWESFTWLALQAAHQLGLADGSDVPSIDLDRVAARTTTRFSRALRAVEDAFGAAGIEEVYRGIVLASRLARLARRDLETHLRWLSNLDAYVKIARRLDRRIQTERPNIDRETFVEPREMCSTTHVHNDHRLVVIESGTMVFWGRPEMRLRMVPGDMILVPRGRLHGSSVESEECVYHQPIIPDEWVRPLVDEVERRPGWPAEDR